jgi:hypothetical protein
MFIDTYKDQNTYWTTTKSLTEQKKELNRIRMQNSKINAEYTIYMNCPKKTLKENFAASKGGLSRLGPLRSVRRKAVPREIRPKAVKPA